MFWNGKELVATSPFKSDNLNRKDFVDSLLNTVALPANGKVEYDAATGMLSIALPKGASAKFDLNKHEVRQRHCCVDSFFLLFFPSAYYSS